MFGMTERKEAIRETARGPSSEPETVSSEVHVKSVLENFVCHPHCLNSDLIEDPTLIVRNDRNLSPMMSLLYSNASKNARILFSFDQNLLRLFKIQVNNSILYSRIWLKINKIHRLKKIYQYILNFKYYIYVFL